MTSGSTAPGEHTIWSSLSKKGDDTVGSRMSAMDIFMETNETEYQAKILGMEARLTAEKERSRELHLRVLELEAENKQLRNQLQQATTIISTENLSQVHLAAESKIARLEKSRALMLREINFLREQLNLIDNAIVASETISDKAIRTQKASIDALTKAVDEWSKKDESVAAGGDRNSSNTQEENHKLLDQIQELKQELEKERVHKSKIIEEAALIEKKLIETEKKIGCLGEYDRNTTKVVHLINNPSDTHARSQLQRITLLQQENERLEEALRQSSSFKESASSQPLVTATPATEAYRAEKERMTAELEEMKLRMQRLKDGFKAKVHDFRVAVYRLFGYRLDVVDDSYRLSSMYSPSPNEYLLFKLMRPAGSNNNALAASSGDEAATAPLALCETDMSRRWIKEAEFYLASRDSVPGFVSAVTLQLLAETTIL